MFTLSEKSKIWALIEKYDGISKYSKLVESLSNILKGEDIDLNMVNISPYLDLVNLDLVDLTIIDNIFSKKLEELCF